MQDNDVLHGILALEKFLAQVRPALVPRTTD